MIGFLRGNVLAKSPPSLLLDVNGVGYEVEAPMTTFYVLPLVGEPVSLYIHLVVREDAQSLFGFATLADRQMFRALIKVNGVGPKLALTILSGQTAEEFQRCIQQNDSQALLRLPGVGKKTAERLIIEMRDRLPDLPAMEDAAGVSLSNAPTVTAVAHPQQDAVSALCALGYKSADANKMVQAIDTKNKSCEDIIRLALQSGTR